MHATAAELDIDIISEPPRVPPDSAEWYISVNRLSTVVVRTPDQVPSSSGSGQGHAYIKLGELAIVGCYCSPNVPLRDYSSFLSDVEQSVRSLTSPGAGVVLTGDFNAKLRV